jgi:hypothetical protein
MTSLPRDVPTYDSAHGRAQWATRLLWATVVMSVVAVLSGALELQLLSRAAEGGMTDADATANDARQRLIGLLQILLLIATAIAFLRWQHRAHRNLQAFQAAKLQFTPGWAVGYWFIPIINLFRPYQTINELWRASAPEIEPGNRTAWQAVPAPAIVGVWWACFLITSFLGRLSFRLSTGANTLPEVTTASWVTLASDAMDVLAALCAILVVRGIDQRQEAKAARRA